MSKQLNSKRQALTDEDLNCLADLARELEGSPELFVTQVREAVDRTWERHDFVSSCPANIKALEKKASKLYTSLRTLNKYERKFIEQVLEDSSFAFAFDKLSGEGT